jgi:hypothetical protein
MKILVFLPVAIVHFLSNCAAMPPEYFSDTIIKGVEVLVPAHQRLADAMNNSTKWNDSFQGNDIIRREVEYICDHMGFLQMLSLVDVNHSYILERPNGRAESAERIANYTEWAPEHLCRIWVRPCLSPPPPTTTCTTITNPPIIYKIITFEPLNLLSFNAAQCYCL